MVEARGSEVALQIVRQSGVVAQHDAFDDSAPLARQAARRRPAEPAAKVVGEAGQAAAPADDAPPVAAQDDVDPLATEPARLVEPMRRPAGPNELPEHLEAGALRRRPATRKLEQHGLVDPQAAEARDAGREAKLEPASAWRAGHGHQARLCPADSSREHASVEDGEPYASPPRAGEDGRAGDEEAGTVGPDEGGAGGGEPCSARDSRPGGAEDERRYETEDDGRGDTLRDDRRRRGDGHGATRSRSSSRRAGPIPGTASSSSTEVKAPCFWR